MSQHRKFIRHPTSIPLEISEETFVTTGQAHNVSEGGLAFHWDRCPTVGGIITLRIPLVNPPFETRGQVVWCTPGESGWEVGIRFLESSDVFRARMVEQVCHIEQYRRETQEREGRQMSTQEAAREWILKFAAQFPNPTFDSHET